MSDSRRRIHEYSGETLTVYWDAKRCIHSEECVRGLPEVFDAKRRPWIDPAEAGAEEIRDVIFRCPTGALHWDSPDRQGEPVPEANTVRVAPDGPLYVSGRLSIELPDGGVLEENRAALCRCGASANKPFCDDSHVESEFEDNAGLGESKLAAGEGDGPELRIGLAADGPLLVNGPISISGVDSEEQSGVKGALCRCGASDNKPYCDGSHKDVGFSGD